MDVEEQADDPALNIVSAKACKWDPSLREIGKDATWTLSSAKPRFDVEQLTDANPETYWQSDGAAPHVVHMQFPKKVTVEMIAVYLDYKTDESYTPSQVLVKAGTTCKDAMDIHTWSLKEPEGWVLLLLHKCDKAPVRANYFSLSVLQNHQSGRDTHIRLVKVFTQREAVAT
eukprot:CAMPEP_0114619754 /NCGR_PEP_ID=MMETSP0168-20121206/8372_1 /TAXON_ID=95228 ORGANISM="Vannella sp., Strain DIVA3 517/6/12" /NCGR_SAMPLE_ID=MMETSP0168 /ASSEMBLY_ACC=CAM_ASM_000044 /LENGTH=171 /DNA_ID=CAMNT_0001830923 /DNA_START=45 /DNA_END=557 /DNA_ORIENTATION=-